jgi:hypothetical protein
MNIKRYSDFINESSNVMENQDFKDGMALLESEYLRMKSENLSEEEINENIFTNLLGSLGGGFTDTFKNYMVDWAAEKFGIMPFDQNGQPTFFYQLIRNVIEGVHFTEIGKYFGSGSCKHWAEAIVEGLAETLEERTISYILPMLGLNIDMRSGMGATIATSIREALTNAINDTKFVNRIEAMISDKICNFGLTDVFSGGISQSDKMKLSGEVERAGKKNPDVFARMMKTGLSDVITPQ